MAATRRGGLTGVDQLARESILREVKNILPRLGAVGRHGSISVVERVHQTLKEILLLITVPEHRAEFEQQVRNVSVATENSSSNSV